MSAAVGWVLRTERRPNRAHGGAGLLVPSNRAIVSCCRTRPAGRAADAGMTESYEAIPIGPGPNGLDCAAYLAPAARLHAAREILRDTSR